MGNCVRIQENLLDESQSKQVMSSQIIDLNPSTVPIDSLQSKHEPLSLDGKICLGFCTQAYDGDTCTINIRSEFGDHQWKVRITGYDAPEMKTKNATEKKHAIACRNMLLELIGEKYVIVSCGIFEKYGRLLGNIYIRYSINTNESVSTQSCERGDVHNLSALLNVNEWMLQNTSCVPYDGGQKKEITYDKQFHPSYIKHLE